MSPEDSAAIQSMIAAFEERITTAIVDGLTGLQTELAASEDRSAERANALKAEILRVLDALARASFARFHSVESNQTDINIRGSP